MARSSGRVAATGGSVTRARRILVLLLGLAACETATPNIQETQDAVIGQLSQGEALAVVNVATSDDILECVCRELRKAEANLRVLAPATFRDATYPWFEPDIAPTRTEDLATLLARPLIKDKISELGVRYVVALSGQTTYQTQRWGGVIGGGTYPRGAAFILGGTETDKQTKISAAVLDLSEVRLAKKIDVSAEGEGAAGMIVFIPYVFLPPATEVISCEALADRIAAFLDPS